MFQQQKILAKGILSPEFPSCLHLSKNYGRPYVGSRLLFSLGRTQNDIFNPVKNKVLNFPILHFFTEMICLVLLRSRWKNNCSALVPNNGSPVSGVIWEQSQFSNRAKNRESTKKSTKVAVNVFRQYLEERRVYEKELLASKVKLAVVLRKLHAETRNINNNIDKTIITIYYAVHTYSALQLLFKSFYRQVVIFSKLLN